MARNRRYERCVGGTDGVLIDAQAAWSFPHPVPAKRLDPCSSSHRTGSPPYEQSAPATFAASPKRAINAYLTLKEEAGSGTTLVSWTLSTTFSSLALEVTFGSVPAARTNSSRRFRGFVERRLSLTRVQPDLKPVPVIDVEMAGLALTTPP
jgi:hypothetical protein